jgi:hypothetical protein
MTSETMGNQSPSRTATPRHQLSNLLLCLCVAVLAGCQQTPPRGALASHPPSAGSDARIPVPLLPRMAEHQLENMRDHLAAIQEITAALANNDFAGVERAAARIGYSEQMGQMCERMGAGAPGFNELALNFHRTADTIGTAARQRDANATLQAVTATLQTCVGCHTVYRQQIVDAATWEKIIARQRAKVPCGIRSCQGRTQ